MSKIRYSSRRAPKSSIFFSWMRLFFTSTAYNKHRRLKWQYECRENSWLLSPDIIHLHSKEKEIIVMGERRSWHKRMTEEYTLSITHLWKNLKVNGMRKIIISVPQHKAETRFTFFFNNSSCSSSVPLVSIIAARVSVSHWWNAFAWRAKSRRSLSLSSWRLYSFCSSISRS